MTIQEILKGESKNIEFKAELPPKSEKYMKSVIAFSNTGGGKIVIGVDDKTHEIKGVDEKSVFQIMDAIANAVSAIREMIVNAVCHRNYQDNSCIQIAIYDNRVEVTSPGMLYGGLTLEEALNGRSKIRLTSRAYHETP